MYLFVCAHTDRLTYDEMKELMKEIDDSEPLPKGICVAFIFSTVVNIIFTRRVRV